MSVKCVGTRGQDTELPPHEGRIKSDHVKVAFKPDVQDIVELVKVPLECDFGRETIAYFALDEELSRLEIFVAQSAISLHQHQSIGCHRQIIHPASLINSSPHPTQSDEVVLVRCDPEHVPVGHVE